MSQIQNSLPQRKVDFPTHEAALRSPLAWIRARYDSGAVTPAVLSVIKMLETELAWRRHRGEGAP
jgi:hypothetical protein